MGTNLNLEKVRVANNGTVALSTVDLRFELVQGSDMPFSFETGIDQSPCRSTEPHSPTYTFACTYPVPVAAGATADIAVHLRLSPSTNSATAPSPKLKVTVGDPATGDNVTVGPINRVKLGQADLSVKLAAQPEGRVGDVVDVRYTVANNGPNPLDTVALAFDAPSGTEWTGAGTELCPSFCKRPLESRLQPDGQPLTLTRQLKILSATVDQGSIGILTQLNAGSPDPYLQVVDPNTANNNASFAVTIDTSTGPVSTPSAGTSPTASASPTTSTGPAVSAGPTTSAGPTAPSSGGPLPVTGAAVTIVAAVGAAVLAVGAVLLLLARRRRRLHFTVN